MINDLFMDNEKLVYSYLSKYAPREIANEDLLQELRIGLLKACKAWEPNRGSLSTLAFAYMRNILSNYYYRLSVRVPTVDLEDEDDDLAYMEHSVFQVDDSFTNDIVLADRVSEYLQILSPTDRSILHYKMIGYSTKEVALLMDISVAHVSRRLRCLQPDFKRHISNNYNYRLCNYSLISEPVSGVPIIVQTFLITHGGDVNDLMDMGYVYVSARKYIELMDNYCITHGFFKPVCVTLSKKTRTKVSQTRTKVSQNCCVSS